MSTSLKSIIVYYCVGMVFVTLVSRYVMSASCYQSRSLMNTRGLIPRNWPRQFLLNTNSNMSHQEGN